MYVLDLQTARWMYTHYVHVDRSMNSEVFSLGKCRKGSSNRVEVSCRVEYLCVEIVGWLGHSGGCVLPAFFKPRILAPP